MKETSFDRAWRGVHAWAWWVAGYQAGREVYGEGLCLEDLDRLEWIRMDREPSELLRWALRHVPAFRDLDPRKAWESFYHQARRDQRENPSGWVTQLAASVVGWS